jgi:hypothetical protein
MKNILFLTLLIITSLSLQAQKSFTGNIVSKNGNKLIIKAETNAVKPATTDSCSISKDLTGTSNPFGIKISGGWMGIADAMYLSAKGDQYTFKITKETTNIVINGKKKDQFVPGQKVKVEWK